MINIGVPEENLEDVADTLRHTLGETYALYIKTHGYHWNVTGPNFKALHDLFEEQYRELWAALDVIAERIRALGAFAPASTNELLDTATITADNSVPDAATMIANLIAGNETVARAARNGLKRAEQAGDDITAGLLHDRAAAADKAAWMLRASL